MEKHWNLEYVKDIFEDKNINSFYECSLIEEDYQKYFEEMAKELESINFCLEAKYIENERCYDLFICRPGYHANYIVAGNRFPSVNSL